MDNFLAKSKLKHNLSCEMLYADVSLINGIGQHKQEHSQQKPFGCNRMNFAGEQILNLANDRFNGFAEVLLEETLSDFIRPF